ncbi:probable WRKY transcription factor 4 [Olea europaea subsp. europaea]|uniref:Probable WRKY transcription factor 4 n=1 Tax=Olea europaea subsp. europaea TaxID=158383 RepID=A0A8S0PEY1_OLEEU|nr:probable WRKY transcription factor 4 [Olea europaea subsp. europaea]
MGETVTGGDAGSKGTAVSRPTITVPPRGFMDTTGSLPGFSPGPLTLVSGFFSEQSPFSFSQLLAGAMASPIAKPGPFSMDNNFGEEKGGNSGDGSGKNNDSITGYKRNRPMNLAVASQQMPLDPQNLSPLFMIPPGLSPSGLLNSPGFLSPLQSPFGMSHQQALAHVTAQAALSQSYMQMQAEFQRSSSANSAETTAHHMSSAPNESSQNQIISLPPEQTSSKIEQSEVSLSERKPASVAVNKPTNDGYNWRKYGQKHVKASECPRSYYKCTHFNCPVKKKVERSVDGHITEITYKGQHNHDVPQPSKRGRDSCALEGTSNSQVKPVISSQIQSEMSLEKGVVPFQPGPSKVQVSTQSVSEHLPGSINLDEVEDSTIVKNDGDDDEPNTKRRSIEIGSSMQAPSHKTITESRIVLQTRSEVDLLDDGYKWRKYGQKVVKGNPHPRSYYKCTHAGCNVRKHVERSSTDFKSVITTYEGKHDHEIPTGRYSRSQKSEANNPSLHKEMDYENKDQMAMTLQLKEEQIAA